LSRFHKIIGKAFRKNRTGSFIAERKTDRKKENENANPGKLELIFDYTIMVSLENCHFRPSKDVWKR
jgi:hypothetical protein